MSKIRIEIPSEFYFSTIIPVRITDINYGGHVGNNAVLSIIHEARVRFFRSISLQELNHDGPGLIMSNVAIDFKAEIFYGDELTVYVACTGITNVAFDMVYKLEKKNSEGEAVVAAIARTGMVSYDYNKKKVIAVPENLLKGLAPL